MRTIAVDWMVPKTATMKLHGVDVAALTETMEAIGREPELARCEFRATNRWLEGGHNRSTVQGFFGAGREEDSQTRRAL